MNKLTTQTIDNILLIVDTIRNSPNGIMTTKEAFDCAGKDCGVELNGFQKLVSRAAKYGFLVVVKRQSYGGNIYAANSEKEVDRIEEKHRRIYDNYFKKEQGKYKLSLAGEFLSKLNQAQRGIRA